MLDARSWKFIGSAKLYDGSPNPNLAYAEGVPISADFVCWSKKTLLMVDGCFWHECPKHGSGRYPGKKKLDMANTRLAESAGWRVIRIWQHDIKPDQMPQVTA